MKAGEQSHRLLSAVPGEISPALTYNKDSPPFYDLKAIPEEHLSSYTTGGSGLRTHAAATARREALPAIDSVPTQRARRSKRRHTRRARDLGNHVGPLRALRLLGDWP